MNTQVITPELRHWIVEQDQAGVAPEKVMASMLASGWDETVAERSDGSEVNAARTSQGMFFGRSENDICARVEARIAHLLNWPAENGEGLQVLRYAPGAEYLPHYDYFDPSLASTEAIIQRGG